MKKAGMTVGLHVHYNKISTDDPYLKDKRLNCVAQALLSKSIGPSDTTIPAEGPLNTFRDEKGRKIIRIDDEFISYESCSQGAFRGCTRALFKTKASNHKKGSAALQPDFDDWPRFIRIDQNTSIQDEISERIDKVYSSCGFEFLYFDGAEDVPNPYWYNVGRAQQNVWSHLSSPMLFAEGALKSHWGWHILSRGNAFDHFKDDRIGAAMSKYILPTAQRISEDFTAVNFGWLLCDLSPESYELVCSEAFKHSCPISYVAILDRMDKCPTTARSLEIIKHYEDLK